MKNIIYKISSLFIFLLLLTQTGCEKAFDEALDRADDARESLEGVLNDKDKIDGLLSACYGGMPKHRSEIYFWTTLETITDNAFEHSDYLGIPWYSGKLTVDNTVITVRSDKNTYSGSTLIGGGTSFWGLYWGGIRFCNTFINNVDNITVPEDKLKRETIELMRDEAIVLRAFYHFQLIALYGPLPFMSENPEVNFQGWETMTRPTYHEIATILANELQGVIDRGIIPLRRSQSEKFRVPLRFAYGLKSRILLYNASPLNNPASDPDHIAKYEAAAAAAQQFIALGDGFGGLEPFEDSKKRLYNSPASEDVESMEVIWRSRDRNDHLAYVHGLNMSHTKKAVENFKAGETPTQEIVDCYELENGALIIDSYDASHANPTFTQEALEAGYDDVNDPYGLSGGPKRDKRFYRDILYNGSKITGTYDAGDLNVYTYVGAEGTGSNGNVLSGNGQKTYTGYYFSKDRDPLWFGSGNAGVSNFRVNHHMVYMRCAEIYLNLAEALCGAGQLNAACDALDHTRLRANQPGIRDVPGFTLDKDWLMKRIYNERRVELVVERHRFFDVRRWDIISDQDNNAVSGILAETATGPYLRYQLPFQWVCHSERYKVLPIPLADKKLLPAMEQPLAWQ